MYSFFSLSYLSEGGIGREGAPEQPYFSCVPVLGPVSNFVILRVRISFPIIRRPHPQCISLKGCGLGIPVPEPGLDRLEV